MTSHAPPDTLLGRGWLVEIDGQKVRASTAALARAAGMAPSTVYARMKARGCGPLEVILQGRRTPSATPVTIEGETFPSHREAMRVLSRRHGVSESTAYLRIRDGVPTARWRPRPQG